MRKKGSTKTKFTVIIGYALVVGVLVFGLVALYNNLVDYSNKRIDNQDLSELLVVSNTLSLLYEIESDQNLMTPESAERYFQKYDSIVPVIHANLNELKETATDTLRVVKLDSIKLLVDRKKENLLEMAVLLDSIRQSPRITRTTESSYVPRELNREISDYLEGRNLNVPEGNRSDTSVVVGERKGFLNRMRDAITGRPDSTIVIESRSVVADQEFRLIVDTIINKVRYSETLDLERQRYFQQAFFERQEMISHTNRMLTMRIDDLLKGIEQEEMAKSVQLLIDKEEALSRSENTMHVASLAAVLIAVVFGVLFLIDINKSQRYRRQLEASNRRVTELLAARERLMLTISHDIKAPMSSILGYLELMIGGIGKKRENDESGIIDSDKLDSDKLDSNKVGKGEPQKVTEYLTNMQHSGQHVLQLVSTLLDYHKLESGTWQLKRSNVGLRVLIDETTRSFKPMAVLKGLEYRVENELPEAVDYYTDPYVTRQVMSNLISNAIKYTLEGTVAVVAREEERENGIHLVFTVSDTGLGMDSEEQQVIFQDFKQLDNTPGQAERVEGSGLGLAITKRFVETMEGDIQLESEKGVGSRFTIDLPIEPSRETTTLEGDEKDSSGASASISLSVLVVDDDPVQLKMTSEMLAAINMKGVTEQNPEKVLQLLEEQAFDVLLIDLQMPGTDGVTLVNRIRESGLNRAQELPIIALSARSDILESELQSLGFSGFLIKPFSSEQLYGKLLRLTGGYSHGYSHGKASMGSFTDDAPKQGEVVGVEALIHFVKEDKATSIEILQSFSEETTRHIASLKTAFVDKDAKAAGKIAHKILPLARMMGDESLIMKLEHLEKEEMLPPEGQQSVATLLEEQVKEAGRLIEEIEGHKDKEAGMQ